MSEASGGSPHERTVGPRLADGRFVSAACPDCGYGTLRQEGADWRCDGLVDPENDAQGLQPCERAIVSGVLYPHAGPNAK